MNFIFRIKLLIITIIWMLYRFMHFAWLQILSQVSILIFFIIFIWKILFRSWIKTVIFRFGVIVLLVFLLLFSLLWFSAFCFLVKVLLLPLLQLSYEAWIWINLNNKIITLLLFCLSIDIAWEKGNSWNFIKYAITSVAERDIPAIQCTKMLVYFLDSWIKLMAVSKWTLRS